jgi:argininosuccinate lyase
MGGLPFRTAHEIVAEAAEAAADAENGTPDLATIEAVTADVTGDDLATFADPAAVEAALDPVESVASRDSRGGPAPDAVAETLDDLTASVAVDADAVADRRTNLRHAAERREEVVADYV